MDEKQNETMSPTTKKTRGKYFSVKFQVRLERITTIQNHAGKVVNARKEGWTNAHYWIGTVLSILIFNFYNQPMRWFTINATESEITKKIT